MDYVQRLVALGLKRPAAEGLESLVKRWTESSGPEWTVSRLKQIKLAILNYRAGRPLGLKWVKLNKLGVPSGPLSELFRLAVKNDRGLFIAVNSTMIYSSFINDYITESQRKKFFGSMESEDKTGIDSVSTRSFKISDSYFRVNKGLPWCNALLSSSVYQPGLDGKSYPETDTVQSLKYAACSVGIRNVIEDNRSIFDEIVPNQLIKEISNRHFRKHGVTSSLSDVLMCVGKISYIQEPGLKLRAVANPSRVIQAALEPLKEVLGRVLSTISNDSTFDQESGVLWVQDELRKGNTVFSIDLSDATNLFPLSYTEDVLLRRISIHDESRKRYELLVQVFVETSRSLWFTKENGVVETHVFTRGQPLGLAPSFFAFALSHHIIIQDLCKDLGLPKPYPYVVLGDDVCISNNILASAYMDKVRSIGCKIALDKSMTSSEIAEFGGKVITKDSIIPQFKWRDINDVNFFDFSRNLGPNSLALLSPKQREVVELLASVPEDIGGMGWNPEGLPLDVRLGLPMSRFLFMKGNPEVFLPQQRVDRPLLDFMVKFSIDQDSEYPLEASRSDAYRNSFNKVALIPARGEETWTWGSKQWWKRFHQATSSSFPTTFHLSLDSESCPYPLELFKPIYRPDGPFEKAERNPWFDIVRFFTRTRHQANQLL